MSAMFSPWVPVHRNAQREAAAFLGRLDDLTRPLGWRVVSQRLVPGREGGTEVDAVLATSQNLYVLELKHLPGAILPHPAGAWIHRRPNNEEVIVRSGWLQVMRAREHLRNWLGAQVGGRLTLPVEPRVILTGLGSNVSAFPGFVREIFRTSDEFIAEVAALPNNRNHLQSGIVRSLVRGLPTWDEVRLGEAQLQGVIMEKLLPTEAGPMRLASGACVEIRQNSEGNFLEAVFRYGSRILDGVRLLGRSLRFKLTSGRLLDLPLQAGMCLLSGR